MSKNPVDPDPIEVEPETEAQLTNREKYRKIAEFHKLAQSRDPGLCTYSSDAKFCEKQKVYPRFQEVINLTEPKAEDMVGLLNEVICFCEDHQKVPRYVLLAFRENDSAENAAANLRRRGYSANIWQQKHIVVGPTADPTRHILMTNHRVVGHFEAQMYEDVLMAAIERLGINLDHIMGRGGNV